MAEISDRSLRTLMVYRVERSHLASYAGNRPIGRNLCDYATTRITKCKITLLFLTVERPNGDNTGDKV